MKQYLYKYIMSIQFFILIYCAFTWNMEDRQPAKEVKEDVILITTSLYATYIIYVYTKLLI